MIREQVIVTQVKITKAGQVKHFQVRLPKNAKRIIVLTESSKFTQTGVVSLFPLDNIDAVYTDEDVPPEAMQLLHAKNVHIHTVEDDELR